MYNYYFALFDKFNFFQVLQSFFPNIKFVLYKLVPMIKIKMIIELTNTQIP